MENKPTTDNVLKSECNEMIFSCDIEAAIKHAWIDGEGPDYSRLNIDIRDNGLYVEFIADNNSALLTSECDLNEVGDLVDLVRDLCNNYDFYDEVNVSSILEFNKFIINETNLYMR
ncbi:MAG: hypothetical protein ACI8TE_001533 [Francisella sp.]